MALVFRGRDPVSNSRNRGPNPPFSKIVFLDATFEEVTNETTEMTFRE